MSDLLFAAMCAHPIAFALAICCTSLAIGVAIGNAIRAIEEQNWRDAKTSYCACGNPAHTIDCARCFQCLQYKRAKEGRIQ